MEVKNCKLCGIVFKSEDGGDLCERCGSNDGVSEFSKVRDYLYAHRGANMLEIERETGVSRNTIREFIKANRIEFMEEKK